MRTFLFLLLLALSSCEDPPNQKMILHKVSYELDGTTRFKLVAADGTVAFCRPEEYLLLHEGDIVQAKWIHPGSILAQ